MVYSSFFFLFLVILCPHCGTWASLGVACRPQSSQGLQLPHMELVLHNL